MSDDNNGNASSAEQTIPKARLDEVLAERRRLEEQLQFQQQMLSQVIEQQRKANQVPERESPELEELKQSNPTLYNQIKRQSRETKELRAAFANVNDQLDRQNFLSEAGEAGKKRLKEVEQVLEAERRNGNFRVNRLGVYTYLQGQDRIRQEATPKAAPSKPIEPVHGENESENDADIPSTNPKLAATVTGGSASVKQVEKTREERIAELANLEF